MRKKDCITLHYENLEDVTLLPDSYAGELFKGIIHYSKNGSMPIFSNLAIAEIFHTIQKVMREEEDAYQAKCEKYRANAMKRYSKTEAIDTSFAHLWTLYDIPGSNKEAAEKVWSEMQEAERMAVLAFLPSFIAEHPVPLRMHLNKFLKKKPWQNDSTAMAKK